jgi:hypothetical protein
MDTDKIKSWEILLADAIGEDAAVRILYDTATRPLRWLSGHTGRSGNAAKQRHPKKKR